MALKRINICSHYFNFWAFFQRFPPKDLHLGVQNRLGSQASAIANLNGGSLELRSRRSLPFRQFSSPEVPGSTRNPWSWLLHWCPQLGSLEPVRITTWSWQKLIDWSQDIEMLEKWGWKPRCALAKATNEYKWIESWLINPKTVRDTAADRNPRWEMATKHHSGAIPETGAETVGLMDKFGAKKHAEIGWCN